MKRSSLEFRAKTQVGRFIMDVAFETGHGPLVIVGPNGSGKTTLLSLILGALSVRCGYLSIGGHVLLDTDHRINVSIENRRIGYVPQDFALMPNQNVADNVLFAVSCGKAHLSKAERASRVNQMLIELGLLSRATQSVQTLSGGERQRVALARALAICPRALLLDEPLSAMDVHARRQVRLFLSEYLRKLALPTILVTHDADDAEALGDRVMVLEEGHISQEGTWGDLSACPKTKFVEEFIGRRRH